MHIISISSGSNFESSCNVLIYVHEYLKELSDGISSQVFDLQ